MEHDWTTYSTALGSVAGVLTPILTAGWVALRRVCSRFEAVQKAVMDLAERVNAIERAGKEERSEMMALLRSLAEYHRGPDGR